MLYVVTKNIIAGYHNWPNAPEEHAYLASRHRHNFYITCLFGVLGRDREIEVIQMQRHIQEYLMNKYACDSMSIDIGGMSCEMLAEEIAQSCGADCVEVLEDGWGGAAYARQ